MSVQGKFGSPTANRNDIQLAMRQTEPLWGKQTEPLRERQIEDGKVIRNEDKGKKLFIKDKEVIGEGKFSD